MAEHDVTGCRLVFSYIFIQLIFYVMNLQNLFQYSSQSFFSFDELFWSWVGVFAPVITFYTGLMW